MALINEPILDQTFEIIRTAVMEILKEEIANQNALQPGAGLASEVFEERSVKVDVNEGNIVNILFVSDNAVQKTPVSKFGDFVYYIDVWTSKKQTSTERGDTLSRKQNQRILGVIRGILEASIYKTLGFAPGFVQSTNVSMLEVSEPDNRADGSNTAMGRINFTVRSTDINITEGVRALENIKIQFKINNTDKGHLYEKDL